MPLGTTKIGCRPPSPTPSPTSVAVAMAFPEAGACRAPPPPPPKGLPSIRPLGHHGRYRHGGEGFAELLHTLRPTCPISHTLHQNFIGVDPHGAAVPVPVFMETSPPDGIPAPAGIAAVVPEAGKPVPESGPADASFGWRILVRRLPSVLSWPGHGCPGTGHPGGENTLLLHLAGPGSSRRRASRSQCPMSGSLGLGSRAT